MNYFMPILIVFACLQDHVQSKCAGTSGTECCFGFSWDSLSQSCKPCRPGFDGINCSKTCRYPNFGVECQGECKCPPELCDFSLGCVITSTKEEFSESTTGISETYRQATKSNAENESEQVLFRFHKQWLIVVFSLFCTIIAIIVIFICCGKKIRGAFCKKRSAKSQGQNMTRRSSDSYTHLKENISNQGRIKNHCTFHEVKDAHSIYEEIDSDTTTKFKSHPSFLRNQTDFGLSPKEGTTYIEIIESEDGPSNTNNKKVEVQDKDDDKTEIMQSSYIEMCQQSEDNNSYLSAV
ncbi:uncharacterized protein LOC134247107 [Saccostrea cucullata]|uniref:uncharacterized protein LOC134247107 n=1 Tax=Saccostrea cuccullata TaxID=36930 RepID=UPI002ED0D2CF